MKNQFEKIKIFYNSNKKKVNLFGSLACVMFLIIIAIAISVKIVGVKITYEELEERLEKATYNYLSENPNVLPNTAKPTVLISANTLIENNYLKELSKYVKDSSCTANVMVNYVNNDYKYQAYLTCDNFKTENFTNVLKNNNKISQIGEGLYEMNNELVYRGQNPNNYVSFADELWRIVKIDKEGKIHLLITETGDETAYGIWDDRYNAEIGSNYGINNYSLSRVLTTTKEIFDLKYSQYAKYLTTFNLCVGKRAEESTSKSGNIECNELIENQNIGLLPVYDYMNASLDGLCTTTLDKACQNYNYLADSNYSWWTMTANLKDTYSAYTISYGGEVYSEYTYGSSTLRYVITLASDVLYNSGDGTKNNPYTIR